MHVAIYTQTHTHTYTSTYTLHVHYACTCISTCRRVVPVHILLPTDIEISKGPIYLYIKKYGRIYACTHMCVCFIAYRNLEGSLGAQTGGRADGRWMNAWMDLMDGCITARCINNFTFSRSLEV